VDSTLPRSRPLGQSLPLGENSWSLSICMLLCRRSFHGDGSPSPRLFALGLRANKSRLMEPCCLGGSPSSFIDQARGVLLFVFFLLLSAALLDIHILNESANRPFGRPLGIPQPLSFFLECRPNVLTLDWAKSNVHT